MFVSFTDWEFDGNVDNAVEAAKGFWPEMQKYGVELSLQAKNIFLLTYDNGRAALQLNQVPAAPQRVHAHATLYAHANECRLAYDGRRQRSRPACGR